MDVISLGSLIKKEKEIMSVIEAFMDEFDRHLDEVGSGGSEGGGRPSYSFAIRDGNLIMIVDETNTGNEAYSFRVENGSLIMTIN